ncbi:MAG: DUF58 domain-containing protein [Bacteroidota bacterium]
MDFFSSIFLSRRFFIAAGINVAVFVLAYFFPLLMSVAQGLLGIIALLLLVDGWMVFQPREGIKGDRSCPEKFSNGDHNPVWLWFKNGYAFPVMLEIIDEIPVQFQKRDFLLTTSLAPEEEKELEYLLRPTERGEYHFGALNVYARGPIGLVKRRYRFSSEQMVPTYPSYIQLRKFQLMAISNRLTDIGVKKVRRLGHTTEFEQIKEYVRGDDYRTVNWKATARTGKLMVNQFADEKSQPVYCLIDKSRNMKMPFEGLTLLDYAINASLVMSHIAMHKHDKAGLITFAEQISTRVPASNRPGHMSRIQEALYNQETRFLEADYARLFSFLQLKVPHRSLMLLFSNFESLTGMRRHLPYLQRIARNHLLVVVFFENTELKELIQSRPTTTEEVYIKITGEHFNFQKKQMVRELDRHGIISILTTPQNLTVNTVNKYLEIKAKGAI